MHQILVVFVFMALSVCSNLVFLYVLFPFDAQTYHLLLDACCQVLLHANGLWCGLHRHLFPNQRRSALSAVFCAFGYAARVCHRNFTTVYSLWLAIISDRIYRRFCRSKGHSLQPSFRPGCWTFLVFSMLLSALESTAGVLSWSSTFARSMEISCGGPLPDLACHAVTGMAILATLFSYLKTRQAVRLRAKLSGLSCAAFCARVDPAPLDEVLLYGGMVAVYFLSQSASLLLQLGGQDGRPACCIHASAEPSGAFASAFCLNGVILLLFAGRGVRWREGFRRKFGG